MGDLVEISQAQDMENYALLLIASQTEEWMFDPESISHLDQNFFSELECEPSITLDNIFQGINSEVGLYDTTSAAGLMDDYEAANSTSPQGELNALV